MKMFETLSQISAGLKQLFFIANWLFSRFGFCGRNTFSVSCRVGQSSKWVAKSTQNNTFTKGMRIEGGGGVPVQHFSIEGG